MWLKTIFEIWAAVSLVSAGTGILLAVLTAISMGHWYAQGRTAYLVEDYAKMKYSLWWAVKSPLWPYLVGKWSWEAIRNFRSALKEARNYDK